FLGSVTVDEQNPAPATAVLATSSGQDELPQVSRAMVRTLFILAQIMYLGFYIGALANMDEIHEILTRYFGNLAPVASGTVFVTAMIAIPLRFFLLTATGF